MAPGPIRYEVGIDPWTSRPSEDDAIQSLKDVSTGEWKKDQEHVDFAGHLEDFDVVMGRHSVKKYDFFLVQIISI